MQHSLEKLVKLPKGELAFEDEHVQMMLDNVGNINPHVRDDLVYTLFARGFMENAFTQQQEQTVITTFIKEKKLFKDIAKPENDRVFLRSFSALLGSVILEKDSQVTILSDSQRQQLFAWSIDYLQREKDYRGFVQNKGWAHSVAHGSDFLGAALNHHKFITQNSRTILQLLSVIFENMKKPFVDDEEQRLAFAFYQGINAGKISQNEFADFICTFDQERYQALDRNNLLSWYKLSSWLKLMQSWYFFFDSAKDLQIILKEKITKYYTEMGYE